MIVRVLKQVQSTQSFSTVLCATDSDLIAKEVEKYGFKAVLTKEARTGSDRISQTINHLEEKLILNVQGDEPLVDVELLKDIAVQMKKGFSGWITAYCDLEDEEIKNPHCVKVKVGNDKNILGFYRQIDSSTLKSGEKYFKHVGIYGYSAETLKEFANSPSSEAEEKLSLEQLRVFPKTPISGIYCSRPMPSVDTPEDLEKVLKILETKVEN